MSRLYLMAQIAGRAVAFDAAQVESVVDIGAITPAPLADRRVRGLAALRSRVVTVIDTHHALGLPPAEPPPTRAVITVTDGHHYALLVDALDDVAPFVARPLPAGVTLGGEWRAVGTGEVERAGEPVLVVDLARLVAGPALAQHDQD